MAEVQNKPEQVDTQKTGPQNPKDSAKEARKQGVKDKFGDEGFMKEDDYKNVPHHGKQFEEGGKKYYWNFSENSPVGTTVDRVDRAYREDMGGYFGVRTNVRVVEVSSVNGKTITKWEVLDGHGAEMKGDPNPDYGKPNSSLEMPNFQAYKKMYQKVK